MKTGTWNCASCGGLRSEGIWHDCTIKMAVKADTGKPRFDLIDAYAMEELAKVLTFGSQKYAAHNWRSGLSISRLCAALLRHTFSFLRGEDIDPETGLSHIAHAMCNCMFILWTMKHKSEQDDRHKL